MAQGTHRERYVPRITSHDNSSYSIFFSCPSIQIVTSHLSASTSCCLSRSQSPKHLQNHGVSSIIQKILPKEIPLHHLTSFQKKKTNNSPKPHSPKRSTWSRPDVADRAQDVDTATERCPRVGLVGFNDPKRLI